MNLEQIDQGLMELILFVLDYGISCVRDVDGPFTPCVTVEDEGGTRHLRIIVADRLERAIDEAMAFAGSVDTQSRVAVSYDGFVAIDEPALWSAFPLVQRVGAQMNAIIVVARDRGRTEAQVVYAQRYKPNKARQRFRTVGDPVFLGQPSQG
ncbi:MAG: hypothetical protein WA304_05965 [Candidatus Cybelea sp.]